METSLTDKKPRGAKIRNVKCAKCGEPTTTKCMHNNVYCADCRKFYGQQTTMRKLEKKEREKEEDDIFLEVEKYQKIRLNKLEKTGWKILHSPGDEFTKGGLFDCDSFRKSVTFGYIPVGTVVEKENEIYVIEKLPENRYKAVKNGELLERGETVYKVIIDSTFKHHLQLVRSQESQ